MLNVILFISSFYLIRGICISLNEKPFCSSCRWFLPNSMGLEYGLCKLYKYNYNINSNQKLVLYEFAENCRNDETMCGKNGILYDKISPYELKLEMPDEEELIEDIFDKYDELKNRGCGEVNEINEIEEIEEEFIYLFEKIKNLFKRHNNKKY